jgi:hypothetical protein
MVISVPPQVWAQVAHLAGDPPHFLGRLAFLGFPQYAQAYWEGLSEESKWRTIQGVVRHNFIQEHWGLAQCDAPSMFLTAVEEETWL